jgi:hypothetical protein
MTAFQRKGGTKDEIPLSVFWLHYNITIKEILEETQDVT